MFNGDGVGNMYDKGGGNVIVTCGGVIGCF